MGMSMEIHVLLLVLLLAVKALSQGKTTLLRIDCGAESSYDTFDDGSHWEADENYIASGTNENVSTNSLTRLTQLNTLRVFKKGSRNCYTLPTPTATRYPDDPYNRVWEPYIPSGLTQVTSTAFSIEYTSYGNCSWAWATAQSIDSLMIQLKANENSTLPPVISAIEVYTASGDGNPSLPNPKRKKNLALIIGLSVGLPVGLLLILVSIYFIIWRKPNPVQGQVTIATVSRPKNGHDQAQAQAQAKPQDESMSMSTTIASTQGLLRPSQNNIVNDHHRQPIDTQENVGSSYVTLATSRPPQPNNQSLTVATGSSSTVNGNPGNQDLALQAPDFNQEELNKLLELHSNRNRTS
ncbi:hypothetical protein CRG98_017699 [Punica granatum]|uniref:Malectin-like domain-containing protein n=1 Tax=Punica granatum TaxID=22663 RepID=A0A2I0K1L3_PUNGR|nr:hypothetical protein CRG98_017699 [Punica granatum]